MGPKKCKILVATVLSRQGDRLKDHDYAMTLVRQRPLQLVLFPGETTSGGTTNGHIY